VQFFGETDRLFSGVDARYDFVIEALEGVLQVEGNDRLIFDYHDSLGGHLLNSALSTDLSASACAGQDYLRTYRNYRGMKKKQ
jgi:hypothetical protein